MNNINQDKKISISIGNNRIKFKELNLVMKRVKINISYMYK